MKSKNLYSGVYGNLLLAAKEGNQEQFSQWIKDGAFTIPALIQSFQLTMENYQSLMSSPIRFKYYNLQTQSETEGSVCEQTQLVKLWHEKENCIGEVVSIYNSYSSQWIPVTKSNLSNPIEAIFNQPIDSSLPNRIVIIQEIIKKINMLACKALYHPHQLTWIDYLLYRLRYSTLLERMKKKAFLWASHINHIELMAWLLSQGIAENTKRIALETTLTEPSLTEKRWKIVKYLYEQGITIGVKYLDNLVCSAIRKGEVDIIQSLLTNISDEDQKDHWNRKIILEAINTHQDEVVLICLEHLDKSIKNDTLMLTHNHLKEILLCATQQGYTEVVQSLLQAGMPTDICDEKGNTLLAIAMQGGHTETTHYLQSQGAYVRSTCQNKHAIL